jgi:hypothetical protein
MAGEWSEWDNRAHGASENAPDDEGVYSPYHSLARQTKGTRKPPPDPMMLSSASQRLGSCPRHQQRCTPHASASCVVVRAAHHARSPRGGGEASASRAQGHVVGAVRHRLVAARSAFLGRSGTGAQPSSDDLAAPVSAFDIVFGKPSAPTELYEKIANDSRELHGVLHGVHMHPMAGTRGAAGWAHACCTCTRVGMPP